MAQENAFLSLHRRPSHKENHIYLRVRARVCACVRTTQTTGSTWVKKMALAHSSLCLPSDPFGLCVHRWSHEYQEATIEKIIRFLQGRPSQDSSGGSDTSLEGAAPMGLP